MNRVVRPIAIGGTLAILLAVAVAVTSPSVAQEPAIRRSTVPAGSLAEARQGYTTTLLPDGRVLAVGGWAETGPLTSAEIWDPETMLFSSSNGWIVRDTMVEPRALTSTLRRPHLTGDRKPPKRLIGSDRNG